MRGVGHYGADHPGRHVDGGVLGHTRHGLVVVRPPDLKTLTFEIDAVEGHRLRGFIDGPELQEREILVQVDLTGQHGVAGRLRQPRQVHLLVEELHHLVFRHPEGDVAHVESAGLARDCRTYNGNSRLRGVRNYVCGNLPRGLHGLVLQGRDVLKPRRRHIPVQRRLSPARAPFLSRRC